jgi:glycolate oxidase FAD binding subunit
MAGPAPTLRPESVEELADAVASAAAAGRRLAICGGGSKEAIGADAPDADRLDMSAFAGAIDHDAPELVLTAGAATPLATIQSLLREAGQMLAFEPFDHGPIFGQPNGRATLGGIIAAAVAGSQRLTCGGVRDHLLGFRAVSGRGEAFVAGAKVVKNVTGYDLPKLACGSWGRLFALTEVTFKVLPAPRYRRTMVIDSLDFGAAQAAMSRALGSRAGVAAAAYLPPASGRPSHTAFRLQGVAPSVAARADLLVELMAATAMVRVAGEDEAEAIWDGLRTLATLPVELPLWRIAVAPSLAAGLIAALAPAAHEWLADWGGGLIWLASGRDAGALRAAAAAAGGDATLVRASPELRAAVPALPPQPSALAGLESRVRRAFDPAGVFATGRFAEQGA